MVEHQLFGSYRFESYCIIKKMWIKLALSFVLTPRWELFNNVLNSQLVQHKTAVRFITGYLELIIKNVGDVSIRYDLIHTIRHKWELFV